MGFVIDKQGDYLPVFGEAASGGANSTYIPPNTTYTVKTDGTGDFTSVADALSYLNGKWSSGTVTISIGEGTFQVADNLTISRNNNIPYVELVGSGTNKTILSNSSIEAYSNGITINHPYCRVSGFTYTRPNGTISTTSRGICPSAESKVIISNVEILNCTPAIMATCAIVRLAGTLTMSTGAYGVLASCGSLVSTNWGTTFNITDVGTGGSAIAVEAGGQLHVYAGVFNWSNVTNKVSQTVGSATNNGWITGVTV